MNASQNGRHESPFDSLFPLLNERAPDCRSRFHLPLPNGGNGADVLAPPLPNGGNGDSSTAQVPRVRHASGQSRHVNPWAGRAEPVLVAVDSHGFRPPVRQDGQVIAWVRRPEPVAPCTLTY